MIIYNYRYPVCIEIFSQTFCVRLIFLILSRCIRFVANTSPDSEVYADPTKMQNIASPPVLVLEIFLDGLGQVEPV